MRLWHATRQIYDRLADSTQYTESVHLFPGKALHLCAHTQPLLPDEELPAMHCLQLIGEVAWSKVASARGIMSACQHPAEACPPLEHSSARGIAAAVLQREA